MNHTPLSPGHLESHLWEAANILRGPVDAADFKTYVFPLLFFKRISDGNRVARADILGHRAHEPLSPRRRRLPVIVRADTLRQRRG